MSVKVFLSSVSARSYDYQRSLLAPIVPGWPDVPTFIDTLDIPTMLRLSTRRGIDHIYCASFACLAESEPEFRLVVAHMKKAGCLLTCVEENRTFRFTPKINTDMLVDTWKDARKTGAARRGAQKSAAAKKARTAAALKLIENDLRRPSGPGNTTRELLKRVGVKSVNSIKDHYGINRETMQARYQAELARKRRREKYREQRTD